MIKGWDVALDGESWLETPPNRYMYDSRVMNAIMNGWRERWIFSKTIRPDLGSDAWYCLHGDPKNTHSFSRGPGPSMTKGMPYNRNRTVRRTPGGSTHDLPATTVYNNWNTKPMDWLIFELAYRLFSATYTTTGLWPQYGTLNQRYLDETTATSLSGITNNFDMSTQFADFVWWTDTRMASYLDMYDVGDLFRDILNMHRTANNSANLPRGPSYVQPLYNKYFKGRKPSWDFFKMFYLIINKLGTCTNTNGYSTGGNRRGRRISQGRTVPSLIQVAYPTWTDAANQFDTIVQNHTALPLRNITRVYGGWDDGPADTNITRDEGLMDFLYAIDGYPETEWLVVSEAQIAGHYYNPMSDYPGMERGKGQIVYHQTHTSGIFNTYRDNSFQTSGVHDWPIEANSYITSGYQLRYDGGDERGQDIGVNYIYPNRVLGPGRESSGYNSAWIIRPDFEYQDTDILHEEIV